MASVSQGRGGWRRAVHYVRSGSRTALKVQLIVAPRCEGAESTVPPDEGAASVATATAPAAQPTTAWFGEEELEATLGLVRASVLQRIQDGTFGNPQCCRFEASGEQR